jgi:hypothetical protein
MRPIKSLKDYYFSSHYTSNVRLNLVSADSTTVLIFREPAHLNNVILPETLLALPHQINSEKRNF